MVYSTQALQYPIHMSLISGGFQMKNYIEFENELKKLCKNEKPLILKPKNYTSIIPNRFWTGIEIKRTDKIKRLQIKLQKLRNKHAIKKEEHQFHPLHITLAFPAKVENLQKIKSPVDSMVLDRITIVRRDNSSKPYKIYKHIKIGL